MGKFSYSDRTSAALQRLYDLGREVANSELDTVYALGLSKKQRTRLIKDGMITCRKVGRSNAFTLTDRGFAWVVQHGIVVGSPIANTALNHQISVLNTLNKHVGAPKDYSGDIVLPGASAGGGQIESNLEVQITQVIKRRRTNASGWVYLSEIRETLVSVSKEAFDEAVLAMVARRKIELTLEEDQKLLTQAQRDAAVRSGGEYMHLARIR